LGEHLEQQLGTCRRQRYIAKLVDDQQLHRCKVALHLEQAAFVARFQQLADQRSCGRERHRKPLLAGSQTEGECDMRLARAAVAQCNDVLAPQDILTAGKLQDEHLVEAGDGGKVERVEALHRREPRRPDTPLDRAPFAIDQLELDEPQQVAGMIGTVTRALARHLVILAQHGGQLQLLEVMGQQHLRRAAHRADRHRIGYAAHAASTA
jgi:hypothetical protein